MSKATNDDQIIDTVCNYSRILEKIKRQLEANDGELVKKEKDGELVIIDPVPKTVLWLINKDGP